MTPGQRMCGSHGYRSSAFAADPCGGSASFAGSARLSQSGRGSKLDLNGSSRNRDGSAAHGPGSRAARSAGLRRGRPCSGQRRRSCAASMAAEFGCCFRNAEALAPSPPRSAGATGRARSAPS